MVNEKKKIKKESIKILEAGDYPEEFIYEDSQTRVCLKSFKFNVLELGNLFLELKGLSNEIKLNNLPSGIN